MALLQRALETYESHVQYTQNRAGMAAMAPIGHIVTRADLEITLDPDGKFLMASAVDKQEPKIVIPVTEASAGRTSAPCPHPLCEQIGYLHPRNETKYTLYTQQLAQWIDSEYTHPKLGPILNYVRSGTIVSDLYRCDLIKLDAKGVPENDKLLVRWKIQGSVPEACWLDSSLQQAYTGYSLNKMVRENGLCMVTGTWTGIAEQHPKGVFSLNGNAKLISANDSSGFTYRGRFVEEWQAAQVGYEASQKAHSALRWLLQEQRTVFGGRAILCWNPQGKTITPPTLPFRPAKPVWQPDHYQDALAKALEGKKRDFQITDGVVVAAFDAATTGRLAVTYYNEFRAHDFLQRLHDWDQLCCWYNYHYGIYCPTLKQIVNCAFGTEKTENGKTNISADDGVMRQQIQRLLASRIEGQPIGMDVVNALVNRSSQPQAYSREVWENILFAACAVVKKSRYDRFKEEWKMALEKDKKDRSYQFGRLLAVMDKVERDTYDSSEERETNAMRMQSVFCKRPMHTAKMLEDQLEQAYFRRLKPWKRDAYRNLMGQIMGVISQFPQETWDLALEDSYLMGYYLQRCALYEKNTNNTEENENECAN